MNFLRRNYLWPPFPHGLSARRAAWLLWRWWAWPIQARRRQAVCERRGEHGDFVPGRVGRLMDLEAGGGLRTVYCGRCGVTVWTET
jgi:hypothetical protein